jgi:hypothetical protein
MGTAKQIPADEALKLFAGKKITVSVSKPITIKGKDGAPDKPGFKTEETDLQAEHILGAAHFGDKVVITTINGRKHEAQVRGGKQG